MGVPGADCSDWNAQLILLKKAGFAIWIWLYFSTEVSRRSQGKHYQATPCRRLLCTPSLLYPLSPVHPQSVAQIRTLEARTQDTDERNLQFLETRSKPKHSNPRYQRSFEKYNNTLSVPSLSLLLIPIHFIHSSFVLFYSTGPASFLFFTLYTTIHSCSSNS